MKLKKRPVRIALLATLIAATGAQAQALKDKDEATSDDVTFSATIQEQCGIDVTIANADLAFGEQYNDSKAQVKLINNEDDGKIELRLEPLNVSDLGNHIDKEDVWFKSGGVHEANMNAKDWEEGIEYSRSDIRNNNLVDLSARINVDESNLDADQYTLVTNWVIECDD
ncbi:hypothetical protein [Vibrio owensii]|uniref:hypothetical protein n=1 Tax=Vibrio owensii TaxID=696485 RepID=UPI00148D56DC|nr:hypothetical protein [Vibrio owensii]NOI70341.1 hypothetical protein [Vibrio owensii]